MVLKSSVLYLCKDKRSVLLSGSGSDPGTGPGSGTGPGDPAGSDMSAGSVLEEIRMESGEGGGAKGGGTAVEVAEDYTKRKCVFRVKTAAGSECLFQVYHCWGKICCEDFGVT